MSPFEPVKIRPLKKEDLKTMIEIDERVLGENWKNYSFMPWDYLHERIGSI